MSITGDEPRLVNLMPHDLVVMNGTSFIVASSGRVARIEQFVLDEMWLRTSGATQLFVTVRYGAASDLPDPRPGVLLVVSRTVAAKFALPDLVFPDLEIRDENQRIIEC